MWNSVGGLDLAVTSPKSAYEARETGVNYFDDAKSRIRFAFFPSAFDPRERTDCPSSVRINSSNRA